MSRNADVQHAMSVAAALDQPAALALHDELRQLGMVGILKAKRKSELAALGLLAGYNFKGYGCGSCLAQIDRALQAGTLREALNFTLNPFDSTNNMAELKKYKPTAKIKGVRRFSFRDKEGRLQHIAPQNMTDENIADFEKSRPAHKGVFFTPVKKATTKK